MSEWLTRATRLVDVTDPVALLGNGARVVLPRLDDLLTGLRFTIDLPEGALVPDLPTVLDDIPHGSVDVAVDAKYTASPLSSPYTGTAPRAILDRLRRDFDDEIRRYGLVMADPSTPVARLRIIANTPESVAFLTERAESLPGDHFDIVGVLVP